MSTKGTAVSLKALHILLSIYVTHASILVYYVLNCLLNTYLNVSQREYPLPWFRIRDMYDTEHTRIFSHFVTAPRSLWNITWIISQTISRSPDSLRYNQLGPHGPFFTIWALLIVGQRPGLLGPPWRPNVLLCGVDFLLLVCLFPLLSIKSGGLSVRVERRCTSCRLVLRQFYADDNGLFVGVRISLTSCICVITESGQYHCTGIWRQSRKWEENGVVLHALLCCR